ncbi:MAG: SDR family NAD(P)-dependent oxidoreductase [Roseitalea sp.]|jgi:NAD(P)-dependent dehydrogenase (short-subunit alcohol dehydrogenase family)|nr:SDR family NAD(P)-dependent oxidoreductase [Roseitalea sp.]MBO6723576.1 SDR family NAD(P)-dependent oxidoreductase [Roseitalea sp.]MBO6741852.1 SDR family NAD(P)-dependent oxidoreductase [Roseitalea sp.]
MGQLREKFALVTGGTRSVGRGIALGLGEAGATVFVTGRSITERRVAEITEAGGRGIAIPCDHGDDHAVRAVFDQIADEAGRLDILVNNAWGGYARLRNRSANKGFKWKDPFWTQPLGLWDEMHQVGVRSTYVASSYAAPMMIAQGSGLIVNISFYAARRYYGNVAYGAAKAATDAMSRDMAHELKSHGVAVVSLYPGHVIDKKKGKMPKRETARFVGRAVAALAADPDVMTRSGEIQQAALLARDYGFTDVDGTQPNPYDTL